MNKYLGIDVGGTEVKFAIVDDNGEILERDKIKTIYDKDAFINDLKLIILKYKEQIKGVGISFPGFIDSEKGILNTAGALHDFLGGFPLGSELEKLCGITVHIENDAKCAAISEMWTGAAKDVDDFICITVGTGIGGAIVVDRKLIKGHNFSAGEFGFMITDANEKECLSFYSGIAARRYVYAKKNNMHINDVDGITALSDDENREVFYKHLITSIHNLIYIINPQKVLIGGSISKDEVFMNTIKEELINLEIQENISYIVEPCINKNNAGILGSVYELKRRIDEIL